MDNPACKPRHLRRPLVAALALQAILTLPCLAVTVGRIVTSDSPNNGCTAPPLVETFASSAPAVYVYFEVSGATVGEVPSMTVTRPGGTVYSTFSWSPVTTAGAACFSNRIPIGGTPAATYLGVWLIQLSWNNTSFNSLFFGIGQQGGPLIHGVGSAALPTVDAVAGSIVSVVGLGFAPGLPALSVTTLPLPRNMNGAQVLINGIQAPLFYVSDSQINAQVPWEVSGSANLTIQVVTGQGGSVPAIVPLAATGPAIFALVHSADGSLVSASKPAVPGEYLVLYASGLGPVSNRPATGAVASASPLSSTAQSPAVSIGDVSAPIVFSGLAPGFVGLYQVNLQVPDGVPGGSAISLLLQAGANSIAQSIAVNAPAASTAPQLVGAFNYAGEYPTPGQVTYKNQSGQTIVSNAYPGQIFLSVAADRMNAAAATALITANNGAVIAQIPNAGLYWIQVAVGKEAVFLSALQGNALVIFAGPNVPATGAQLSPVPLPVPAVVTVRVNCWVLTTSVTETVAGVTPAP
jgi:uncharacterized protein (TIGR03437 family)